MPGSSTAKEGAPYRPSFPALFQRFQRGPQAGAVPDVPLDLLRMNLYDSDIFEIISAVLYNKRRPLLIGGGARTSQVLAGHKSQTDGANEEVLAR